MSTEALAHEKAPAKRLDRRWQGPFRVLWCPLEDSNLRFRPEKSASLAARRRGRAYTNTPFPQVGWAATEWARAEVVLRGERQAVGAWAGGRRQASGDAGFQLKCAGARADVRRWARNRAAVVDAWANAQQLASAADFGGAFVSQHHWADCSLKRLIWLTTIECNDS